MPVAAELYYSLYQKAETDTLPVVLLHGAAGNRLSWAPDIRRLKGYRVFALDLPGHGKSATKDAQQTIAGFAKKVIDWLDAVDLRRAVFVGHSMGGAIALELGLRYPQNVLALGLISTGVRLRVNPQMLQLASTSATFTEALNIITAYSFSENTPRRLVELATKRMAETRPSVLHGDLRACNSFDVKEQTPRINRPVIVICGTDDQMTPLRHSQYMASTIPHAQLHVINRAGHMLILERSTEVAAVLDSFLSTISYKPGEED